MQRGFEGTKTKEAGGTRNRKEISQGSDVLAATYESNDGAKRAQQSNVAG